jgi:hypothetical protein
MSTKKTEKLEVVPTATPAVQAEQSTGLILNTGKSGGVLSTNGVQAPSFMMNDVGAGLEAVSKFILPPRLVICQPTSKAPLNDYDQGTALLLPEQRVVAAYKKELKGSEPIVFAPVFFFCEYTLDNPIAIHGTHPRIKERTFDRNTELARRALSLDTEVNTCPCPDKPGEVCRYTVRMNYFWQLFTTNPEDEPFMDLCFVSMKRTEQRPAMELNTMIRQRRTAIYGNLFVAEVHRRENTKGSWYGFDFFNPPEVVGPWVNSEAVYKQLKTEHERLADLYNSAEIDTSATDDDFIDGSVASSTAKAEF